MIAFGDEAESGERFQATLHLAFADAGVPGELPHGWIRIRTMSGRMIGQAEQHYCQGWR
ncbi:hypothetical protein IRZ34_11080 [Rhodococcus rhodochrous]|nr:hypothetical protein [Rhodococcus rhodochrous]MBF4478303.1 hypothetical protein [Rhodococcus rhodochrous]